VIPIPECRSVELTPIHEFLIIASDGLWDVLNSAEAVSIVRTSLAAGKTPTTASEELCELALKLGSSDNVTIIIVQFTHS
jgi:serine/threonine protein phosphatase PrpC